MAVIFIYVFVTCYKSINFRFANGSQCRFYLNPWQTLNELPTSSQSESVEVCDAVKVPRQLTSASDEV